MLSVIAETTRGGITESIHHGVVVAVDASGDVVAAAGDPEQVVFFRSSAKPFQAIPVIESGAADAFGIMPAELALCCASHEGSPCASVAGAGHAGEDRALSGRPAMRLPVHGR
jgi:L-asparaginase II